MNKGVFTANTSCCATHRRTIKAPWCLSAAHYWTQVTSVACGPFLYLFGRTPSVCSIALGFEIHYTPWLRKIRSKLLQVYARDRWSSTCVVKGSAIGWLRSLLLWKCVSGRAVVEESSISCTDQPCLTGQGTITQWNTSNTTYCW